MMTTPMLSLAKTLRPWGIIIGVTLGGLTLSSRVDDLVIRHLDATFATKADVAKVEQKVDTVLRKLEEQSLKRK